MGSLPHQVNVSVRLGPGLLSLIDASTVLMVSRWHCIISTLSSISDIRQRATVSPSAQIQEHFLGALSASITEQIKTFRWELKWDQ